MFCYGQASNTYHLPCSWDYHDWLIVGDGVLLREGNGERERKREREREREGSRVPSFKFWVRKIWCRHQEYLGSLYCCEGI
jgi:hypothetical protein